MEVREEIELEFSPHTLHACAEEIEKIRHGHLCDIDGAGADPSAEQHYLLALSELETAQRSFTLAALAETRALAES
jgi:hypothetical protein